MNLRVEKFKSGNVVVNCQTEQQAKDFVKWCHANDMCWGGIRYGSEWTFYDYYGDRTCYRFDDSIVYGNVAAYEDYGYEVITYKEFMGGNVMKLSDLKAGMFAKTRGGCLYLVLKESEGAIFLCDKNSSIADFNDDLTHEGYGDYDIVAVYEPTDFGSFNYFTDKDTYMSFLNLVWKREDTKEMTLDEVNKIMQEVKGYKVKIIE